MTLRPNFVIATSAAKDMIRDKTTERLSCFIPVDFIIVLTYPDSFIIILQLFTDFVTFVNNGTLN